MSLSVPVSRPTTRLARSPPSPLIFTGRPLAFPIYQEAVSPTLLEKEGKSASVQCRNAERRALCPRPQAEGPTDCMPWHPGSTVSSVWLAANHLTSLWEGWWNNGFDLWREKALCKYQVGHSDLAPLKFMWRLMCLIKFQRVLSFKATRLDRDSQVFHHNIMSGFVKCLKAKVAPKTFYRDFCLKSSKHSNNRHSIKTKPTTLDIF